MRSQTTMQLLYKGYIPTHDKVPLKKFKDAKDLLTLSQAQELDEYAGLLADNVALIDIDDYDQSERLMNIVEELQLNCRVAETTRGKHFYFYGLGNITKCGTHIKLAVGLEADIKVGDHNSISVLKYKGKERKIIYDIEPDEEYDPVPAWLTPLKGKTPDFMTLDSGDGRNQTLFNYILKLQSAELSNEEIKTTIKLINDYILPTKLDEAELNKILRDESFSKPSFYGRNGNFLFNVFATYLKNNCHIIKLDGQLHIYQDGVYRDGLQAIESEMIKLIPNLTARNRSEVIKYLNLIAPDIRGASGANYIAFNNGIYDLNTNQLEPFSPDIIVTNKIPHNYNYEAYSEVMDAVLDKISCNDDTIRDLLEDALVTAAPIDRFDITNYNCRSVGTCEGKLPTPSWMTNSTYWTATAGSTTHVWAVENGNPSLAVKHRYNDNTVGVRPVVIIDKNYLYKSQVNVTFDLNGCYPGETTPASQTKYQGDLVTKPTDPGQGVSGWRFKGWFLNATGAIEWNFDAELDHDIKLYAKCVPLYTVTFEMNGHGTQVPSQTDVEFEDAVSKLERGEHVDNDILYKDIKGKQNDGKGKNNYRSRNATLENKRVDSVKNTEPKGTG